MSRVCLVAPYPGRRKNVTKKGIPIKSPTPRARAVVCRTLGAALVFWARHTKSLRRRTHTSHGVCAFVRVCRCYVEQGKNKSRQTLRLRGARVVKRRVRAASRAAHPHPHFLGVCVCVCARGGRSRLLRDKNCFQVQVRDDFEDLHRWEYFENMSASRLCFGVLFFPTFFRWGNRAKLNVSSFFQNVCVSEAYRCTDVFLRCVCVRARFGVFVLRAWKCTGSREGPPTCNHLFASPSKQNINYNRIATQATADLVCLAGAK